MSKYLHRLGAQKQKFELEATIHYLKLSRKSQCLVKLRAKRGKDKTEESPSLSYSPLLKQLQFNHILSFLITMYKKGSKYSKKDLNISVIEIVGKTEKKIGSLTIEFHTIAETGKSIEFKEFILKDSKDSAKLCMSIKLFLQQEVVKSSSSSRSDSLTNVRRAFSVDENDSLKLRDEMESMEEDKKDKYKVNEEKKALGSSDAVMRRKVSEKSLRSAFADSAEDAERAAQGSKAKGMELPVGGKCKVQSASVKGSMKKNFHFASFVDIDDLLDEDNVEEKDGMRGGGSLMGVAGLGSQEKGVEEIGKGRKVENKEEEYDGKGSESSSDDSEEIHKKLGGNELEEEKIASEEIETSLKSSRNALTLSQLSRSSSSDSSKSDKSKSKINSSSSKKSESSSSSKSSSPRTIPPTGLSQVQTQIELKADYFIFPKPSPPYLQITLSKQLQKPLSSFQDITRFTQVAKPVPSFIQLHHMTQNSKPAPSFLELNHFKQVTKPVPPSMQLNLLCQVIKPATSFLQLNTWTRMVKPQTSLIELNFYTKTFRAIVPVKVDIFSLIEVSKENGQKDLKGKNDESSESSNEETNKIEFDSDKSDVSSASSNDELKVPEPIFKSKSNEGRDERFGGFDMDERSGRDEEKSETYSECSRRSSDMNDEINLEVGKGDKLYNQYSSVITDSTITFAHGEELQAGSKNNTESCVDDERQDDLEKGSGEIFVSVGEILIENRSRSSSSSSSRSSNSSKSSSSKPKQAKIDSSPPPPNPKSEESDTNIFDLEYIVSSSSESHSSGAAHSPKSAESETFSGPQSDMKSIVPNSSSQEIRLNLKEKESGLPESRNTTCCGKCSIV